jgi:hypothetical protein
MYTKHEMSDLMLARSSLKKYLESDIVYMNNTASGISMSELGSIHDVTSERLI